MYPGETNPKASGEPSEGLEELIQAPTSSGGFVERYYDSGLRLGKDVSKDSMVSREIDRITYAVTLVGVVGSISRRLGREASGVELAIDKKRARRVEHALRQSLGSWSKRDPKLQVTTEIAKEGNQLVWEEFVPAHLTQIRSELYLVATWSLQNEEQRWGRSAIVWLENEWRWVTYAMRD